jgi:hypothetical protein
LSTTSTREATLSYSFNTIRVVIALWNKCFKPQLQQHQSITLHEEKQFTKKLRRAWAMRRALKRGK